MDWGETTVGQISIASASWPVYKREKILLACAEKTLSAVLDTSLMNFGM